MSQSNQDEPIEFPKGHKYHIPAEPDAPVNQDCIGKGCQFYGKPHNHCHGMNGTPSNQEDLNIDLLLRQVDRYSEKSIAKAKAKLNQWANDRVVAELENIPTEWLKIKITDADAYHLLRQAIYDRIKQLRKDNK